MVSCRFMPYRECHLLLVDDAHDDQVLFGVAFRAAKPLSLRLLPPRSSGIGAIRYLSGQGDFADRKRFPYPDFLLLDLKMPGTSGFDVLLWLGQQARRPITYVLTDSTNKVDREKAFTLGATDYLNKPPGLPELADLIRRLDAVWQRSMSSTKPNLRLNQPSFPGA